MASNFFTIAHRPPDHFGFLSTSPILIVLFFGFFRNRLPLQLLASVLLTLSDTFTLLFLRAPQPLPRADARARAERDTAGSRVSRRAHRRTQSSQLSAAQAGDAWRRMHEQGRSACLLMLDLDHFKQVNDVLGHEAGDRALTRFAMQVEAGRRADDLFGRVGGEEFALFMPDIELAQAKALADQLVARCREITTGERDQNALSTSIGVAQIDPQDRDLAATMHRADLALYRAKASGRNCAMVASLPAPSGEPRPAA